MISIALIHTVKSMAVSFEETLRNALDVEVKVHNLWDDFLADDPNEIGEFTINNRNRLFLDMKSAEMTGADFIVVTCSTLTPYVGMMRPFIKVPVIAIDDRMGQKAVTYGDRILILATAGSTKEPLTDKLTAEAAKIGKTVQVDFLVSPEAFKAMKALDMDKHDQLLLDMAKDIKGYDCVVLAQASMAHLDKKIEEICNIPVLANTPLCLEEVKELIKTL